MSEIKKKRISELDPMSKKDAAEGHIPASVGGKTVRIPVGEFGNAGGTAAKGVLVPVPWNPNAAENMWNNVDEITKAGNIPLLATSGSSTLFATLIFRNANEIKFSCVRPDEDKIVRYVIRSASGEYSATTEEISIGGDSVPTGTPALSTMGMNEINAQTSNYGSWNGDAPEWGAESMCQSICFQLKRMSMGNGAVNTCHVYISQPGAQSRFKVGIFDTAGNELGSTDVVDISNTNKPTMMEAPMTETSEGSLVLKSGTMYVVKVVAIGVGFGGSEHSKVNWNFDYESKYNLSVTMAGFRWASNGEGQGVGENNVPFVAFSYKENG